MTVTKPAAYSRLVLLGFIVQALDTLMAKLCALNITLTRLGGRSHKTFYCRK
jgi:hypothetical protein